MAGPIKPSEVAEQIRRSIPEEVFEAFNELIAKGWNGDTAIVKQDTVVSLIIQKTNATRGEILQRHWLDVEEAYRAEGWLVRYEKPAYCESFDAFFEFRAKGKS